MFRVFKILCVHRQVKVFKKILFVEPFMKDSPLNHTSSNSLETLEGFEQALKAQCSCVPTYQESMKILCIINVTPVDSKSLYQLRGNSFQQGVAFAQDLCHLTTEKQLSSHLLFKHLFLFSYPFKFPFIIQFYIFLIDLLA